MIPGFECSELEQVDVNNNKVCAISCITSSKRMLVV